MVELSHNLVAARCRKGSQAADADCATSHQAHKMAAEPTLDQVVSPRRLPSDEAKLDRSPCVMRCANFGEAICNRRTYFDLAHWHCVSC